MKDLYDKFQYTDFDNDIVGMCYTLVEWMKFISNKSKEMNFELSKPDVPERFYKHQPHFPRDELRRNVRPILNYALKVEDEILKYQNTFTCLLAITYIYHMPTQVMYNIAKNNEEFNREKATKVLLDDNMSPNWLTDPKPSPDKDFSAIMMKF